MTINLKRPIAGNLYIQLLSSKKSVDVGSAGHIYFHSIINLVWYYVLIKKMIKVLELYRHPVKSFTSERRDELQVSNGKVEGDRVLAFRFADKGASDDFSWQKKHNFVALVNTPGISRLEMRFDLDSRILSLKLGRELLVSGSIDLEEDRSDLSEAVSKFVSSLEINPLVGHPERLPLNLIGDGRQALFHDSEIGGVTLYSSESLAALQASVGTDIDGRRFRTNVVISGVEAWEELSWTGRLSIGDGEFEIEKTVTRCLATHVNPVDGCRDQEIMKSLIEANEFKLPTFAIRLNPLNVDSIIRVGDVVSTT